MDFQAALILGGTAISIKSMQVEILPKAIEKIPQIYKFFDAVFTNSF
jgi:hypothetical protein